MAFLAVTLGPPLFRLLASSWRVVRVHPERFAMRGEKGQDPVYAMWHQNIPAGSAAHCKQGLTVLISSHRDGEIITRLIEAQGFQTVRGSSTRGGMQAMRNLIRMSSECGGLVLTPDGPRGPAHSIAPGVLFLAGMTGRALIPVGFACSRQRRARSWDRMVFPELFARVAVAYAEPLFIPREALRQPAQLDYWREQLAQALESAEVEAKVALHGERT